MAEQPSRMLNRLAVRMVLAVAIAAVAMAIYTIRLETSYQARALLMLAPMPFAQQDSAPDALPIDDDPGFGRMLLPKAKVLDALPMPDYKEILLSQEVLTKLNQACAEGDKAANRPVKQRSTDQLRRALDVRFKVHFQSLLKVEYQQVVELAVNDSNPAVAGDMANAWAEISVARIQELRQTTQASADAFLQQWRDEVWTQYETSRKALEALEAQSDPEGMKQRLMEMESSPWKWRKTDLALEIAKTEAEIAAAGDTPDKEKQVVLAGLRAQETALGAQASSHETELAALRAETARVSRELDEIKLKSDSQARAYEEVSLRVQTGRAAVESAVREFKIVSRATPPEEKTGPRRSMMVFAAMFLAAVAVPVHFFGMIALRRCVAALERESC
jgi:uncharacterized protein involved in exopolysaccharide biosynthesis